LTVPEKRHKSPNWWVKLGIYSYEAGLLSMIVIVG
jgi:hypothetical protein